MGAFPFLQHSGDAKVPDFPMILFRHNSFLAVVIRRGKGTQKTDPFKYQGSSDQLLPARLCPASEQTSPSSLPSASPPLGSSSAKGLRAPAAGAKLSWMRAWGQPEITIPLRAQPFVVSPPGFCRESEPGTARGARGQQGSRRRGGFTASRFTVNGFIHCNSDFWLCFSEQKQNIISG